MDLTPKRLRRSDSDPPTGLKAARKSWSHQLAERKRSHESSAVMCSDELEESLTAPPRKAHRTTRPIREEPVDSEAPVAAPTTADEMAGLLILKETGESSLEFELEGDVYRVKNVSMFVDAVANGAQRWKQPRRTLSDLKRAQRLAWAREAALVESSAAARAPTPRASGCEQSAEAQELAAPGGRAADGKLLQAWRLAKEVLPTEELSASDAEL